MLACEEQGFWMPLEVPSHLSLQVRLHLEWMHTLSGHAKCQE